MKEPQTDKQIRDETDELLKECICWAMESFMVWSEDSKRTIGITRFLYLKDKVLNHSPKYYRDKETKFSVHDAPIIREVKNETKDL